MSDRPKIKIDLTIVDKVVEAVCLTLLILLWIGTIAFFSKLPDQIPTHFNAAGKADDYGDKTSIFILPVIATVIYTGMTLLNRHPHIYNYPAAVTRENARRLYTAATKLIRMLKLVVVSIFSGIVFITFQTSVTNGEGPGKWFVPLAVALMILPVIIYLLKSSGSRQASRSGTR